jgi:hypothetical protein
VHWEIKRLVDTSNHNRIMVKGQIKKVRPSVLVRPSDSSQNAQNKTQTQVQIQRKQQYRAQLQEEQANRGGYKKLVKAEVENQSDCRLNSKAKSKFSRNTKKPKVYQVSRL